MAERNRVLAEGVVVGLIAYAAVAAFYAVFDVLAARGALFTVNMLSQSLFVGPPDPASLSFPIDLNLALIFRYNALHLVASLAIGFTVVGLVEYAQRVPSRSRLVLFVIVAGYASTIVAVGLLSRTIRTVLPWWSIVAVNSLAVVLSGAYLARKRPGIVGILVRPVPIAQAVHAGDGPVKQ